ncbi:Rho termination factor N-terminal domain-containing protein [Synechococcus sp. BDU 130192]|uniref:Rho termination factor N-terminal domain-containing protein n=1 Tax=Synechococcus sp. BDU 130192 TaxID=2042059 RepID=UPI0013042DC1|nr:Rho termination factor N-terminal domain-containing protein [Synechococcus sp. BDU 130192]
MTLIITATFVAASAYFFVALACFICDSIAARRHAPQAIATTPKPAPQNPIETMNIRQLKKAASQARIKGYSNMRKAQLIAALT